MVTSFHNDHIDPKWSEGRDYMLVCGLDVPYNLYQRDAELNVSKSNRFVPWRECGDDLGTVPVEAGDLCLFLDPHSGEWVLEEFLGKWWYDATLIFGYGRTQLHTEKARKQIGASQKGKKRGPRSDEDRRKISEARMGHEVAPETRAKIGEANRMRAIRRQCQRMSMNDPLMPNFNEL